MKFTVLERLFLFNILETKIASIDTVLTVNKLRKALAFSEDELAEINYRNDEENPGGVRWDCEVSDPSEVKITERGRKIITERLMDYKAKGRPLDAKLANLVIEFLGDEDEEEPIKTD